MRAVYLTPQTIDRDDLVDWVVLFGADGRPYGVTAEPAAGILKYARVPQALISEVIRIYGTFTSIYPRTLSSISAAHLTWPSLTR